MGDLYDEYFDVSFRKVSGSESHFVKIGVGFLSKDGKGRIDVILDSVPINWNGKITLFAKEGVNKVEGREEIR